MGLSSAESSTIADRHPDRRLSTGRLSLEFVSTVRRRLSDAPQAGLAGVQDLAAWLATVGVHTADALTVQDVDEFETLREAIYRLVVAAFRGDAALAADVELVNQFGQKDLPALRLSVRGDSNGRPAFFSKRQRLTAEQTLTLLARDAIDLLIGPSVGLLHQCEARECGTFFIDLSHGARRRWCLSTTCGNRARVQAHRSKKVTINRAPPPPGP